MWGNQPPIYVMQSPQYGGSGGGFPGNDVRFIAVPSDNKEALKILKRQLKEMKLKEQGPKKDDKKTASFSKFETFMLCASTNMLILLISTFILLIRH